MPIKSEAEYQSTLKQMREDKAGEWHFGEYTIKRSKPYNLLEIVRDDGKPVHKSLRGQWTEIESAKQAILSVSGAPEIE